MKVESKLSNLRISPRKVRLVARLIKGLDVNEALLQLENSIKKPSPVIEKLLRSAIANAENNFGLDKDNLYVFDIKVDEGVKLKRWLPRAFGRASQILKRTSNIKLTLEERVEGKGRKSKEQMEKIKKEREEARKKMEKALQERKVEKEKYRHKKSLTKPSIEKSEVFLKEGKKERESGKRAKGWIKKIFQRKSG